MIVRLVRRRLLPSNRRHNRMDGCSNHSSNNGVNHSNSRRGSPGNLNSSGANHSNLPNSPHSSGANHSNLPNSPHSSPGVNRSSHSGCSRHSNSRHGLRRGITAAGVDSSANSKITGLARKIKEGEPEKAWILPSFSFFAYVAVDDLQCHGAFTLTVLLHGGSSCLSFQALPLPRSEE